MVMIEKLSSRLGIKLFVLLTVVITLAILPLVYMSLQAISNYGNEASAVNEQQIRKQAFSYLKNITRERTFRYQTFFDGISASAALLGSHASTLYSDIDYYADNPLYQYDYIFQPHKEYWTNSIDDPVISVYWGAPELSESARQELQALTHMTPLFKRVLIEHPEVLASHVITVSGIGQYCSNDSVAKEIALNLPPAHVFDLRDGEPLTIFTKDKNSAKKVRWTDVYKDDVIDGLMLTASAPVYDSYGDLSGIAGIDVPLNTVIEDILTSERSHLDKIAQFAFLLDNSGRLIAFPHSYFTLFGLHFDETVFTDSSDSLDVSLADSTKRNVRELASRISHEQDSFSQIDIDDVSYYVATSRMENLGWVYGMVVKKSDLFASVDESRTSLSDTVKNIKTKGIVISVLTIMVALVIVYLSVKHLVMPVRNLAAATERVAGGDLSVRCPVVTADETGILAASFNTMVERLEIAQEKQRKYADSLEIEVERRNLELTEKKDELETIVHLLKEEVERRQIISEALRNSQQQYYETMEANRAGIFIITNGVFNYVNQSLAVMMQMSKENLTGLDPLGFISKEDRLRVAENIQRTFRGGDIPPYRVKCIRPDQSSFYGEVWAKVTMWQGERAMVGTITDVSRIKRNEEKLLIQDVQLRKSLEEKEILLKEIYHRTKNNMLVIISMLELQTHGIEDERITTIFRETEERIRAMALVHEKLYQSQDLSEIDLGAYIEEMVSSLVENMVLKGKIDLVMDVISAPINIDYAVPLGLVINEIVTNSVKHAFPGDRKGTISIRMGRTIDGEMELIVGDDGIGLPQDVDVHHSTSFGMQIVNSLITIQLKGTVDARRENGTIFLIRFKEGSSGKRI